MPRTMQVPADLDATGEQLWTTFVALRQCEDEARLAARTARTALRRQPITAAPADHAAMTARYHAAAAALEEITDQRKQAEHAYRAHRRSMLVQSQRVASHRLSSVPTAADVRSQAIGSVSQRRQR